MINVRHLPLYVLLLLSISGCQATISQSHQEQEAQEPLSDEVLIRPAAPEGGHLIVPPDLIDLPRKPGVWNKEEQEKLITRAIEAEDPSICYGSREHLANYGDYEELFTAEEAMNECLYLYAYRFNDMSVCELMDRQQTKKFIRYGSCVMELQSRTDTFSEANCIKIYAAEDAYNGDACMYRVASELEDSSLCQKYLEGSLLDHCLNNVDFRKRT